MYFRKINTLTARQAPLANSNDIFFRYVNHLIRLENLKKESESKGNIKKLIHED